MELREWLIILGLGLVTVIVLDGVRRYKRQRSVPRLDQAGADSTSSPESASDTTTVSSNSESQCGEPDTAVDWELPNGGARVIKPAQYDEVAAKPKLERQDHPGPSRVLSEFRQRQRASAGSSLQDQDAPGPRVAFSQPGRAGDDAAEKPHDGTHRTDLKEPVISQSQNTTAQDVPGARREPEVQLPDDDTATDYQPSESKQPPASRADDAREQEDVHSNGQQHTDTEYPEYEEEDYRLVDLEGMGDSFKEGSRRVGTSVHRFGTSLQRSMNERREQKRKQRQTEKEEKARLRAEQQAEEKAARDAARRKQEADDQQKRAAEDRARREEELNASLQAEYDAMYATGNETEQRAGSAEPEVASHPVMEKALHSAVVAEHAKDSLSGAGEVIIISVMSRDEAGFSGSRLLNLMLACGLRYDSVMGILHRFETEDSTSSLQFSMVNAVKPGTFPVTMQEEFSTPGVTLLMPLPGAEDTSAAFEAMVETAMVIVRHLGGELKDENQSVMTAQTVEFSRQRVQEFERRYRLRRSYQVN